MPRTARASAGRMCYHVLNRDNARRTVFHTPGDYLAFVKLLGEVSRRLPLRVLAYGLMPNHFHLALRPERDGDLSSGMQWLLAAPGRTWTVSE